MTRMATDKMNEGFRLIGEAMQEHSADLLHLALVYDRATNVIAPMVHTFEDIELLKAVLRRVLERIESGEHQAERSPVASAEDVEAFADRFFPPPKRGDPTDA